MRWFGLIVFGGPVWPILGVAALVASVTFQTMRSIGADDYSVYFGGWRLNRELSSIHRTYDEPDESWSHDHVRRYSPQMPAATPDEWRSFDASERESSLALVEELMTPLAHWTLAGADNGAVILAQAEGRPSRFLSNGQKEQHHLAGGVVNIRTKWDEGRLRQEIELPAGLTVVRVFAVMPETAHLAVTMSIEAGTARRVLHRLVYERDNRPYGLCAMARGLPTTGATT